MSGMLKQADSTPPRRPLRTRRLPRASKIAPNDPAGSELPDRRWVPLGTADL
jgi:hypothetical protein